MKPNSPTATLSWIKVDPEEDCRRERVRVYYEATLHYVGAKPVPVVKQFIRFLDAGGWLLSEHHVSNALEGIESADMVDDHLLELAGQHDIAFAASGDWEQIMGIQAILSATLFPVTWHTLGTAPLELRNAAMSIEPVDLSGLEVLRWSLWRDQDAKAPKNALFKFEVHFANRSDSTIPAVVAQLRVRDNAIPSGTATADSVMPGEVRILTGRASPSLATLRKGSKGAAKIELRIGASTDPIVAQLHLQSLGIGLSNDITIRIQMSKGEGARPKVEELNANEKSDLASLCEFQLSSEVDEFLARFPGVEIQSCEMLYDGVTFRKDRRGGSGLHLTRRGIEGYPAPVIRFKLSGPVDIEGFRIAVMSSVVEICSRASGPAKDDQGFWRDDVGFTAMDMNGYSTAISAIEAEHFLVPALKKVSVFSGRVFTKSQLMNGIGLSGLCGSRARQKKK